MATRSVGSGGCFGVILTVFLLTGIKALLLSSWFNWTTFALDLTSYIQTPAYDSVSSSRPELSHSSSSGSEAPGTYMVPNGLVTPGSEGWGAWGVGVPQCVFYQEVWPRSNSKHAQRGQRA